MSAFSLLFHQFSIWVHMFDQGCAEWRYLVIDFTPCGSSYQLALFIDRVTCHTTMRVIDKFNAIKRYVLDYNPNTLNVERPYYHHCYKSPIRLISLAECACSSNNYCPETNIYHVSCHKGGYR